MSGTLPIDAFEFMHDLKSDNTREFWQANKKRFEETLKGPMQQLLTALEDEGFGPFKVFRMNRDVRFSADKSPYKDMYGAVSRENEAHYLHVDAEGVMVVCGSYVFDKATLSSYRANVEDDDAGHDLEDAIDALKAARIVVSGGGAAPLKSAPRGTDPEHPRIHLLRQKGLMASISLSKGDLQIVKLTNDIVEFWKTTEPLSEWLSTLR